MKNPMKTQAKKLKQLLDRPNVALENLVARNEKMRNSHDFKVEVEGCRDWEELRSMQHHMDKFRHNLDLLMGES